MNPIEVKVPKDIKEYKEKIIFGLSGRQLVCSIIAIGVGTGAFFAFKNIIPMEFLVYVIMAFSLPPFAFGFFKKDGYKLEKLIAIYVNFFFTKHKRIYKTELFADDTLDIGVAEKNKRRSKKKLKQPTVHQIEKTDLFQTKAYADENPQI